MKIRVEATTRAPRAVETAITPRVAKIIPQVMAAHLAVTTHQVLVQAIPQADQPVAHLQEMMAVIPATTQAAKIPTQKMAPVNPQAPLRNLKMVSTLIQ